MVAEGFIGHLLFDEATRRTKESMGVDDREDLNREDRRRFNTARRELVQELEDSGWRPEIPNMDETHQHAEQAMLHFNKAISMAPENALYHLGRASLGEYTC